MSDQGVYVKYLPCCICGQVVKANATFYGSAQARYRIICDDCWGEHKKCHLEGVEIRPDGVHPLDPCIYSVEERHENVTVEILKCRKCGHKEVTWIPENGKNDSTV